MKKTLVVILAFVMIICAFPLAKACDDIRIDKTWTILVPENPTDYETFAANKLKECLGEVFGEEPQTVTAANEKFIAVGSASFADVSDVAVNGYRIKAIDGALHINGAGARGLQAGAYRFLEEFCGRKVYTSTVTVLPEAESVLVPCDTDIVYGPFFEYTDTDWKSPCDAEYSMANGLNGGTYRTLSAEMGGTVGYIGGFCHTMGSLQGYPSRVPRASRRCEDHRPALPYKPRRACDMHKQRA